MELYVFDKQLRMLFLDAIERIEVAIRVDIALLLGQRNPIAHRSADQLHGNFTRLSTRTGKVGHADWLRRLDDQMARSKDDFVAHFKRTYSTPLPIWIAIELWDFGMLATFFAGMKFLDRTLIAQKYGLRYEVLESWLYTLNHIRNICAHHSRLWNRTLWAQPKWTKNGEVPSLDHLVGDTQRQSRMYAAAAISQFLLGTVNPQTQWSSRFRNHVATLPVAPGVSVSQMGIPANWTSLALWT